MGGELDSMVSDPTDLPENPNKAECTTVARSLPVICKMFGKKSCVAFNSKMSAKCGGNAAFNIEDGNEDIGEGGKEDDEEMASSDDDHALADEDEDVSSVRVGRRGGAGLMTSGSFVLMPANRAGNDEEEELGEEVPAILSAQYNASLAFMDDIKTTSGRRAYKDECKYAINPCDPVALYV